MTTPNIEELITALTQTNQFHEEADICTADVIAVLLLQAERIKELESECLNSDVRLATVIEHREKLRAQLAEIATSDPVAYLCKRKDGMYDSLTDKTCKQCFPVIPLPMPAPDVTELPRAARTNAGDILESIIQHQARTAIDNAKGATT